MNINVGLEVLKALTQRLEYEGHTYDDVIRDLLKLDSPVVPQAPEQKWEDEIDDLLGKRWDPLGGFVSRRLRLPNGTQLRARHKGREYRAVIEQDEWRDLTGKSHSSPSAAAASITSTNVNGLRFWEARLPGGSNWQRLDSLETPK